MRKGNKDSLIIIKVIALLIIGILGITSYILKETNKIYSKDIKTITIKYYNGYNILTGDSISDYIPAFRIELKGNDLEKVSKLVHSLTYYKMPDVEEILSDKYELIINKDFSIYIDKNIGFDDFHNTFKVPEELYNIVTTRVLDYNKKNVYKQINSNKFTILHNEEKIEVIDKKYIEQLSNYNYYIINGKDELLKDEEVEYILDLNDGRKIELYRASSINRMNNKDGSYTYINSDGLNKLIEKIYENN